MHTILVPPLLCSPAVYASILDTVWSHGSVAVADTLHDDTIADMAARILRTGPARFALLGTSMGGYVALEVVRRAPERVAGLALVSTSARADSDDQLAARRRQSRLVEEGHFDALVDAAFPGVVAARNESDPHLLRAWRGMAASVGPRGFLRQQAATMDRTDARDLLPGITCPTFVIHGAQDRLIPPDAGREIAAAVPTSTLRIVEHAGHFLLLERPDEATALVSEFLDAVRRPSGRGVIGGSAGPDRDPVGPGRAPGDVRGRGVSRDPIAQVPGEGGLPQYGGGRRGGSHADGRSPVTGQADTGETRDATHL